MASQQVLIVTRVALFELVENRTTERGNCACAIVASPSQPPRYSLVCYNDNRETLCTAAIVSSNESSLQFQLQANDYASFRDDKANKWSMMFLKSAQMDKFCAVLGVVFYGASGSPTHTAVIGDFAPPRAETRVTLQHRVKVRYTAFAVRPQLTTGLLVVEDVIETNGDRPYNFQPTQSAMAKEDAKGFESLVLGMSEEGLRAVVVPSTMPRAGRSPFAGVDVVVFVVQVIRILNDVIAVDGAATVPAIFGDQGSGSLVLVGGNQHANSSAMVVHGASTASSPVSSVVTSAPAGVSGSVGSGVPAEHMMMIQKSAAQINTATTSVRDLHDKVVAFTDDWKQSVNRPKPSALTNQGLEQGVKQLIMENERIRDEVLRRDELIRSLDDRNRDLQKRVDTAAMVAQQLMDEKNKTVSSTSDMKLERDRILMKLQEQVTQCSNERDDVHRHLQTVKKLLDVSDNELRDIKGRIDVHNVQAQSLASKLDASEDALAEEKSRRKALEAKVLALQEEIRQAEADLHMKTAAVEELNRKADSERNYQAQLLEDERQRRMFESQQLRSEIVADLHQREAKFQADRARVAEDNFKRGHDEGKQIGRNHARIDVEARVEELVLDAQRAKTELDAYKTELRQANDEALGENRRLESIVLTLKKSVDEATRRKAQNEFQLHGLRLKVRNAADALLLGMTSVSHRLTRPATPDNLVAVLTALRDSQNPNLQFQSEAHQREKEDAFAARYQWMLEDAEQLYTDTIVEEWGAFARVTNELHDSTRQTISRLWIERDEQNVEALIREEEEARAATVAESDLFFDHLTAWFKAMEEERVSFLAAEECARQEYNARTDADVAEFLDALASFVALQAAQRAAVEEDEAGERTSVSASLEQELHDAAGGFLCFLEAQKAERDEVYTQEAQQRAGLEAEPDSFFEQLDNLRCAERSARAAVDDESVAVANEIENEETADWKALIVAHEEKIFEKLIAAQRELDDEETAGRSGITDECDEAASLLLEQSEAEHREICDFEERLAKIQQEVIDTFALEVAERQAITTDEQRSIDVWDTQRRNDEDDLKALAAATTVGASTLNRNSVQPASSSASPLAAAADPLGGASSGTRTSIVESTKKKSAFGAESDSESDGGASPKGKPAVPPKKASAASASPTRAAASPNANLFGSDSDEDAAPKPKAPPKRATAKKAPPPKKNQLFDSDDD